jgi:hypothetical protein
VGARLGDASHLKAAIRLIAPAIATLSIEVDTTISETHPNRPLDKCSRSRGAERIAVDDKISIRH